MAHLKKGPNGHLLKNSSGHMVKECAPTTTTTPAPTTTTSPRPCDSCNDSYSADPSQTGGLGCAGPYTWTRSTGCTWTLESSDTCTAGNIEFSSGTWTVTVPLDVAASCDYSKSGTESDCPSGTYSLDSDNSCGDCDSSLNVYT